MSGYFIQTNSGKQGPFDRNQLAKLVKAGKLPRDFDVEDASSGLLISVGDLVPAQAAAPPPPPPPSEPVGPDLVYEDAELSPSEFAPSLRKANKGARKRGDAAALRRGRAAEPEPVAPAVRARPASSRRDSRPVRSAPSRGGARKRAAAGGRGGGYDDGGRSSRYYRKKSSPAPIIVACVLVLGLGVGGYFFWDDINPWASPFEGKWMIDMEEFMLANNMFGAKLPSGVSAEGQKKMISATMETDQVKNHPLYKSVMNMYLEFDGDQVTLKLGSKTESGTFRYQELERWKYRVEWPDGSVDDVTVSGDQMKFRQEGVTMVLKRSSS